MVVKQTMVGISTVGLHLGLPSCNDMKLWNQLQKYFKSKLIARYLVIVGRKRFISSNGLHFIHQLYMVNSLLVTLNSCPLSSCQSHLSLMILAISCLGNEGLWRYVAMLLNREPFVSDSGDCQRICGGEKGSQLVSGNSWIVKGVIFSGVCATDWKVNTCTTSEEIVFCRHGNTQKKIASNPLCLVREI